MSKVQIFHNPRCSKSRETLSLLQNKGVELEVIEYLKTIPSAETLSAICSKLGFTSAREMMRTKEADYKDNNLAQEQNEAALIAAMLQFPKLIERPIVIKGDQARIGRPPEKVLEIV